MVEEHVSPDGRLWFRVVTGDDGDVTLGFVGFPWHTHADILAATTGLPRAEAVRRFVSDLLSGVSAVALSLAVATSHSRAVLFPQPVSRERPSGLRATAHTAHSWRREAISAPAAGENASHPPHRGGRPGRIDICATPLCSADLHPA